VPLRDPDSGVSSPRKIDLDGPDQFRWPARGFRYFGPGDTFVIPLEPVVAGGGMRTEAGLPRQHQAVSLDSAGWILGQFIAED